MSKKLNLVSSTDRKLLYLKHFLPCVAILLTVHLKIGASLVDVGAGAGFPGIPLKILRPDLILTLLDSNQKKIFFLRSVIRKLKLLEITPILGRVETLKKNNRYDYVISWGVARLDVLYSWSCSLLKPGGKLITIKGSSLPTEMKQLYNKFPAVCVQSYSSSLLSDINQKIVVVHDEKTI